MKTVSNYIPNSLIKKIIFAFLVIFISCQKSEEKKINLIKEKLNELKVPSYEKLGNITNIEKFSNDVTNLVTELINNDQLDISTINGLKKNIEFKTNKIKIYSLNYVIYGDSHLTTFPIIQWKSNDKIYAYNLSKNIQCDFKKVIELNKNLFLLIGITKFEIGEVAYIIEIKKDKINLKYPAFSKRPFLNLNAGKFTYNSSTKILEFKLNNKYEKEDLFSRFYSKDKYGQFYKDSIFIKEIGNLISLEYEEKGKFQLKFNGIYFENNKFTNDDE